MQSDWAYLLPELVSIIVTKASTTNKEYVNLRAVCKPWRAAISPHPLHLPDQVPWLMLPRLSPNDCHKLGIDDSYITFYDLSRSTIHRLELPFLSGKYIRGSSHGWLILEHHHTMSLLNPVTKASIRLPCFSAVSINLGVGPKRNRSISRPSDIIRSTRRHDIWVQKAILSSNPSEPGCVVVANFQSSSKCLLQFCRIGDSCWTKFKEVVGHNPQVRPLWDFSFHNNLVFAVNNMGEVTIYDLEDLSVKTFASRSYNYCCKFVQGVGESGGPLAVRISDFAGMTKFVVYEWVNNGEPKWCQVTNIGKQVLFVNHLESTETLLSSAFLQLEKWQGNQICCDTRRLINSQYLQIAICVSSLGEVDVQNINSPADIFPRKPGATLWLTPSLI